MKPRQLRAAFFHLDRITGLAADPHRLALEAILLEVLREEQGAVRAESEERLRAARRS